MRPSSLVALTTLLLALASPASAAPRREPDPDPATIVLPDDPDVPLPVDPRVIVGRLPNGLTYYVEPNQVPVGRAELRLAVKAGSVLEDDDQRGMAHFVEHMAFNGSRHFPDATLIGYLESIGASLGSHVNAYTSFDETVYRLQVPTGDKAAFEKAFTALRDFADGIDFDPEECRREMGVVREEWRLELGLGDRVQEALRPAQLGGSRYADRMPAGSEATYPADPCAAAKRFHATWYRPELMAVMAVGDFDPAKVEGLIKTWFGGLRSAAGAPERPWYVVPDEGPTRAVVYTDRELAQSLLIVADRVPEVERPTHGAYRDFLLEQIVFIVLNERLAIAAQDPSAPALGAAASEAPLGHLRSQHLLQIAAKEGRELDALKAALTELERLRRFGFTQGELDRARGELARNLQAYYDERRKTQSAEHVEELLRVFLTDEPMPGIPYEYALSRKVLPSLTLEQATTYAREHTFPGEGHGRVVSVLMPIKPGLVPPTEAEVLAVAAEVGSTYVAAPEAEADARPLLPDPPTPGEATRIAVDRKLGTSTWRLSNGVTVVLKRTGFQADEVLFLGQSRGGTSLVADEDYIAAVSATDLMLRSGVGDHTAVELAKLMAGKDAHVAPTLGRTGEYLRGEGSVRDLETIFQLLWLGVTRPRFDASALELERQGRAESLRNRAANPDAVFEDAFQALLWKDHPRQSNWTLDDLGKLDLAASERVYRDRFGDFDDWTFVFVGSFDEATIVPLMERYLATLPTRPGPETFRDDGVRPVDGVHRLDLPRGDTPRAHARIHFHGELGATPANRLVLKAVAVVLETRLREELRERLGGTYGVTVDEDLSSEPVPAYALEIDFETDPARLDELLAETWKVIDEVRTRTWNGRVIEALREKELRDQESDLRTNGGWLTTLSLAIERGQDPRAVILRFDDEVEAITAEAIREVAGRVLDRSRYVEGLQRPGTP